MAERRSPKPQVGGSIPSWPATIKMTQLMQIYMSAQLDDKTSRYDSLKWLLVTAFVSVGVVGNYIYAAESLLYRVLVLLVLASVAGYVALTTEKGQKFAVLVKEARIEIRKVVWPTKQELIQTTLIVIVFVLVVALVLWAIDSLVSWSISGIIG